MNDGSRSLHTDRVYDCDKYMIYYLSGKPSKTNIDNIDNASQNKELEALTYVLYGAISINYSKKCSPYVEL